MTRVALCGGPDLIAAAAGLGLVESAPPDLVLVDTRDGAHLAAAGALPPELPRVLVAAAEQVSLLRAAGARHVALAATAHELGPLVAAAAPRRAAGATRRIVLTAARGGVGRTLLASSLARRLAHRMPVWLIDATGSGTAAWWLRADARPWRDLEPLLHELTLEHLRVVAAEPVPGLRVIGGAGSAPSSPLLEACLRELDRGDELQVVDAPALADPLCALASAGERVRRLVLSYADLASLAALDAHDLEDAWLIASQCDALPARTTFRSLPRDDRAVASALASRTGIGGALGRAHDGLARLLALDAS